MKKLHLLLIAISLVFALYANAQYADSTLSDQPVSLKEKWRFKKASLIVKYNAVRTIGLNDYNDVYANHGYRQLPIIGLGASFELNVVTNGFSLSLEQMKLLHDNSYLPNSGLSTQLELTDQSLLIGYDLLGKMEKTRFEPFIGIGTRTTELKMNSDSVFTFDQIVKGTWSAYQEIPKTTVVGIAGLRLLGELTPMLDFIIQADYRYAFSDYAWRSPDLPIKRLSNVNASFGLVLYPTRLFPNISFERKD